MAFEQFLDKPALEQELLSLLTHELQDNYLKYQNEYFFLKLEKVEGKTTKIIWVKSFLDPAKFTHFIFDTKFERACIMIKFHKGQYEILCQSFFLFDCFQILPDRTLNSRPIECSGDREETPMISLELLVKGFGEISGTLQSTKRNEAI